MYTALLASEDLVTSVLNPDGWHHRFCWSGLVLGQIQQLVKGESDIPGGKVEGENMVV